MVVYRSKVLKKDFYKPGEAGALIGISNQTVIKHCNLGMMEHSRTATGHRRISAQQLCDYLDKFGLLVDDTKTLKRDVIYARVSTHKQAKSGDLERQVDKVKLFAIDHNVHELLIMTEVGSGLNDNRKQLLSLLRMVQEGRVSRIFILYKDRLTRFGFNYIKSICDFHQVEIVIVSQEEETKTQAEELAEDIISIIHSFSGKLYGLRRTIKEKIHDQS